MKPYIVILTYPKPKCFQKPCNLADHTYGPFAVVQPRLWIFDGPVNRYFIVGFYVRVLTCGTNICNKCILCNITFHKQHLPFNLIRFWIVLKEMRLIQEFVSNIEWHITEFQLQL